MTVLSGKTFFKGGCSKSRITSYSGAKVNKCSIVGQAELRKAPPKDNKFDKAIRKLSGVVVLKVSDENGNKEQTRPKRKKCSCM